MAGRFNQFLSKVGNATSPFGFAPQFVAPSQEVDPAPKAGAAMLKNFGFGTLANLDRGILPAIGAGWMGAQAIQNQNTLNAQDQAMVMEQANAKRMEQEQAMQEKAKRDEFIKTLPPDQQMKAMSIPGYLEKLIGATDPALQGPQEVKRYNVGGALVDADGNVIYQDPAQNGPKAPAGYAWTQDGNLEPIKGGPADPKRPLPPRSMRPTTDQTNAAMFYDRMNAAETILSDPEIISAGLDYNNVLKSKVPFGGGNYLVPPEFRKLDQAKRDFINAILRKESGAAIGQSEFENAEKQYFPVPGDDEATLQQKAENRRIAIEGMRRAGAPVLDMAEGATAEMPGQNDIPMAAIEDLTADPSPEAVAEFDAIFGPGAAESVLGGQ